MTSGPPRLPNFLYVGVDKAGSSWLHEALLQHPEIYLSPAKDLYFFDRYYDRGLAWYADQFRGAQPSHRILGEICPDYLAAADAPARIAGDLPGVRVMVTLREPVSRAVSSYLYMRKHGLGPATFREALDSYPDLIEHGRYATQLRRYSEHLDQDHIYIGLFDDLQDNPQGFIDGVVAWMGLEPVTLDEEVLAPRLPASSARFVPAAWAARRSAELVRRWNGASLVGHVKRSRLVQGALYRPLENRPSLSDADAEILRTRLEPEMRALEQEFGVPVRQRWNW
jgi:hypothetical protein